MMTFCIWISILSIGYFPRNRTIRSKGVYIWNLDRYLSRDGDINAVFISMFEKFELWTMLIYLDKNELDYIESIDQFLIGM